ncbi:MAG: tRNA (adenosine(37)-N6)-threonylcarbamoyltransferase complex transferase subunit TsaD [Endomicrobiales bacterium]|nr:tRNA (adenosine(37)-N6)-threonylcarbamoyltransferase complex transferase subunit TsaD [Endomicrobiales bacterium]
MIILAIETSCDETSAALVMNGRRILSNVVSSQEKVHGKYFGVVPELASRAHIENINWVYEAALKNARLTTNDIKKRVDAVAYTHGPGLAGALLVGQVTAQTISYLNDKPLVDVNHLEGHIYSALLEYPGLCPPYLSLIVSGGHTELVLVYDYGRYKVLGSTRDDAAGEAFDKVAKMLNLSYPGGPVIDKLSKKGNPEKIKFPRPYLWPTWEFSFSGLKTAVVNFVKNSGALDKSKVADICAAFQQAVVDTLAEKTIQAAKKFKMKKVVIGGGVAANSLLRDELVKRAKKEKIEVYLPSRALCTDNASMIACAGYYKYISGKKKYKNWKTRKIEPNLKLKSWHNR